MYLLIVIRKMRKFKAFLLTLVLALLLVGCSNSASSSGKIKVELVALDGTIIEDETIKFIEGDTLANLISEEFDNVVISDGMLMEIEDYKTPSNWETFISIYVNDKMSMVGIYDIKLENNMVVSLRITKFIS